MLRPRGRGLMKGFWSEAGKSGLFFSGSFLGFGCGIMQGTGGMEDEAMSEDKKAEARQRYVTGTESLAAIGAALGISENTMGKWCREGKWVQERKKFQKRAARKAINKAVDKKAKELARLLEASECMESALVKAARAFDSDMDRNSAKFANGQMRGRNIESLSKAIKTQLDTRMLISGIMSTADRERIDLMRKKQELEERKEKQQQEQEAGGVKIVMAQDVEELAE